MCKAIAYDCLKISKGEESIMIINTSHIKLTDLLVESTKKQSVDWINVEFLKAYLRENGQSLNTIQHLHEYLLHLQKDKFIFDCAETYLVVYNNVLFSFAKGKYSFTYRLDKLDLTSNSFEWDKMKVPSNMLLRVRNAIDIISTQTDDNMCAEFLYTISSDILV